MAEESKRNQSMSRQRNSCMQQACQSTLQCPRWRTITDWIINAGWCCALNFRKSLHNVLTLNAKTSWHQVSLGDSFHAYFGPLLNTSGHKETRMETTKACVPTVTDQCIDQCTAQWNSKLDSGWKTATVLHNKTVETPSSVPSSST